MVSAAPIVITSGEPAGINNTDLAIDSLPLCAPCIAGVLNSSNSDYVLRMLDTAIDGCVSGKYSAMVTAPVHKGIINDAGIPFSGHTE